MTDPKIKQIDDELQELKRSQAVLFEQFKSLNESVTAIKNMLENKIVTMPVCEMRSDMLRKDVNESLEKIDKLYAIVEAHKDSHANDNKKIVQQIVTLLLAGSVGYLISTILGGVK